MISNENVVKEQNISNENVEIKEILEYFKDDIDYLEEELKYPNFKGRYITIRDKECEYLRKLLDYITNLQTIERGYSAVLSENAELQEELQAYKQERENILDKSKRLNYKLRIDKAIEYIENKNKYLESENYYQVFEYRDIYLMPLLEILKGVDKE